MLVVVLWLFGGVGVVGGEGMEWKKLGMFGEKNGVVWKKFSPTFCLEKFEVFLLDILVCWWWWCFCCCWGLLFLVRSGHQSSFLQVFDSQKLFRSFVELAPTES